MKRGENRPSGVMSAPLSVEIRQTRPTTQRATIESISKMVKETEVGEASKAIRRKRKDRRLIGNDGKCIHGKWHWFCVDGCGGQAICEHNKQRYSCRECGGKSFCHHGRLYYSCKECPGPGICSHNHLRYSCKQCPGKGICEHKKVKRYCKACVPLVVGKSRR